MKGSRPLTRDEFNIVIQSFDGKYAERNRCLFLLGTGERCLRQCRQASSSTAMTRVSELAALTVGDVYRGGLVVSELVLRKQIVKGKKESRIAVLPPETVEAVRDFIAWKAQRGESLAKDAALFRSRQGGHLHRMQIHRILKDAYAEVFFNSEEVPRIRRSPRGGKRYLAQGRTEAGRYLTIAFERKSQETIEVVTARDMQGHSGCAGDSQRLRLAHLTTMV